MPKSHDDKSNVEVSNKSEADIEKAWSQAFGMAF
tara:strand:- start:411 stop:512 length:102 start_codon:yes stop_codon:yes gene_type:complete